MEVTAVLRFLLVLYFVAAFVAAIFYLRHRRAILLEYIIWGTVALPGQPELRKAEDDGKSAERGSPLQ